MIEFIDFKKLNRGDKIIIDDPSHMEKNYIVTVKDTDSRGRIYYEEKMPDEEYYIPENDLVLRLSGILVIPFFETNKKNIEIIL